MHTLTFLLSGVIFGTTGGLVPGPTMTLVIAQTLRYHAREGIKIAFAPLLTDAPIVLASVFVLSRVETAPILGTIALLGAAFLAYLAYESFTVRPLEVGAARPAPQSIRKGVLANLFNPHPYVFWLTIGGPVTLRAADAGPLAVVLFVVSHYICLVGAKVVVALLVERGRALLNRGYVWTIRLLGLALAVFALIFVRDALGYFGLI